MIQKCSWGYNEVLSLVLLFLSFYSFASDDFYGESREILDAVYALAPKTITRIVRTLNGELDHGIYRFNYVFLEGDSGVAKTTLAKAIAYKTKRVLEDRCATEFIAEGRGSTTGNLNNFIQQFLNATEKTVIFFDEVNCLWENYNDPHYDTDATSKAFWNFLDKLSKNNKLFFVGATNEIAGMPRSLRTRLKGAIVEVKVVPDGDRVYKELIDNLEISGAPVSDEARDFLYEHREEYASLTSRDIIHCAELICDEAYDVDANRVSVELEHIKAAITRLQHMEERLNEAPRETDYEQRERHHADAMRNHRDSMYWQSSDAYHRDRKETIAKLFLIGGLLLKAAPAAAGTICEIQ